MFKKKISEEFLFAFHTYSCPYLYGERSL
uniref:Uncharacterized protein n=1 Tax=Anguilla anguilla TaxID=7936 RepID=A0A0E9QNA7_ANGAN